LTHASSFQKLIDDKRKITKNKTLVISEIFLVQI